MNKNLQAIAIFQIKRYLKSVGQNTDDFTFTLAPYPPNVVTIAHKFHGISSRIDLPPDPKEILNFLPSWKIDMDKILNALLAEVRAQPNANSQTQTTTDTSLVHHNSTVMVGSVDANQDMYVFGDLFCSYQNELMNVGEKLRQLENHMGLSNDNSASGFSLLGNNTTVTTGPVPPNCVKFEFDGLTGSVTKIVLVDGVEVSITITPGLPKDDGDYTAFRYRVNTPDYIVTEFYVKAGKEEEVGPQPTNPIGVYRNGNLTNKKGIPHGISNVVFCLAFVPPVEAYLCLIIPPFLGEVCIQDIRLRRIDGSLVDDIFEDIGTNMPIVSGPLENMIDTPNRSTQGCVDASEGGYIELKLSELLGEINPSVERIIIFIPQEIGDLLPSGIRLVYKKNNVQHEVGVFSRIERERWVVYFSVPFPDL